MPRSRARVSKRQNWDSENMKSAVKEVIEKRLTFRNTCIEFDFIYLKMMLNAYIKENHTQRRQKAGYRVGYIAHAQVKMIVTRNYTIFVIFVNKLSEVQF